MAIWLGEIIYIAVKPIFKIYFIIAIGYTLTKKNILTVETSKNISTIAVNVLIPCLAFQKIVSNISNDDIHQIATIVIVSFFLMGLGSLLCFIFGVAAGCPKNWWGGLICCGLLPNISDLPIAYLQTMESSSIFNDIDKGVSYVMIYFTLQMLVQFNFGAFKLIEMDFHTEARLEAAKKTSSQEEKLETATTVDDQHENNPSIVISSSSSSSDIDLQSTTESLTLQRPHVTFVGERPSQNDIPPLLTTVSSRSTLSDEQQQPMLRTTTTGSSLSSAIRCTEPLSRTLSVPRILLGNDVLADQVPEGINDIVRVYSKYEFLTPITEDIRTSTRQAQTFFSKAVDFLQSVNYYHLCKSVLNLWVASTLKIVSMTMIISITICMIPWVQALFVITSQAHVPPAPDGDPPLSFIMDLAGYVGAAEVPFGLLMLGGTIGRLNLSTIPLRVWRVPIAVTFARLFIMPIIGCAFNSKIYRDGLFYDEKILYFISNINFCLPPATSLLYITAFYTPIDDKPHSQMDYLALVYVFHYLLLVICLPFTTTYTMKISLNL
ncbi:hypothetical protein PICMEDRAFT_70564 [Pichia membranifaciens NRRL Y-2026]|uniref:Auxin efflux carrier n=1 Tax=Pichia membranifaciens NRRL Y-2026 TaxID=763406 RepID=A0A1E3NTI3_9ASCO|nr:hypothetical protein PICMEDRAFT_70564 [Pichia membranifaciens NRRL Y-2026]ODQ48978.1 hypothetical protein PICMEDRAFT_70564 [Pichia membranifaciens NRRL Y-2026]